MQTPLIGPIAMYPFWYISLISKEKIITYLNGKTHFDQGALHVTATMNH